MRGDRPLRTNGNNFVSEFTPHARGSTPCRLARITGGCVYPACAGIDRSGLSHLLPTFCLPRMRGDRPCKYPPPRSVHGFTPHARGSTHHGTSGVRPNSVYPACAGIDLGIQGAGVGRYCLPRMRGDRPQNPPGLAGGSGFTPHARGSTQQHGLARIRRIGYPACADRPPSISRLAWESLPRMRGDRPPKHHLRIFYDPFTPHARGSTVGHLGGLFSPMVYPACAGIDRGHCQRQALSLCLPRMRGDRPQVKGIRNQRARFTPHARGSTASTPRGAMTLWVYPACAGIDLMKPCRHRSFKSLPRMRGDRP